MNRKSNRPVKQTKSQPFRVGYVVLVCLLIQTCSSGLRLKNLAHIPVSVTSLSGMDTLRIQPDIIRYTGGGETEFRVFRRNIRLQGDHAERPVWRSDGTGCFRVENGARIHILDFNFDGRLAQGDVIQIDSGEVILENCDFTDGSGWMIHVGKQGKLVLRETLFRNLGRGAVTISGGSVLISDSRFVNTGETSIHATSATILKVTNTQVEGALSNGLDLNGVTEIWLDSTVIQGSFRDGIQMKGCDYAFISNVAVTENGQHGIAIEDARILGLLNLRSYGNLVNGAQLERIDSLRVVSSEFVGNGGDGANMINVDHSRMSGVHFGHNDHSGLVAEGGIELAIDLSRFQGNPGRGAHISGVEKVGLSKSQVIKNSVGISGVDFTGVTLMDNFFFSNKTTGLSIRSGQKLSSIRNRFQENELGLEFIDVLNTRFDSCHVEKNEQGSDFRSLAQITMRGNTWDSNESASYFSEIGTLDSENDRWSGNLSGGIEILSGSELRFSNTVMSRNRNSLTFNQSSVSLETCRIDSGTGTSIKGLNASLSITSSTFQGNENVLELNDGSRCEMIQSKVLESHSILKSQGAVDLLISYCDFRDLRKGIELGEYASLELLSSQFSEVDGYCIEVPRVPYESIHLRQNIMHHSGGILRAGKSSGDLKIISNTFSNLLGGLDADLGSQSEVKHNIFWNLDLGSHIAQDPLVNYNCFPLADSSETLDGYENTNIFADPKFTSDYFLEPSSPCLIGGENNALIGARGINPIRRPELAP